MLKVLAVPGKCAAQAVVAVPPAVPRSDHLGETHTDLPSCILDCGTSTP